MKVSYTGIISQSLPQLVDLLLARISKALDIGQFALVRWICSPVPPMWNRWYCWKEQKAEMEAFLEWILSPQGQAIIEKVGYVSLFS